MSSPTDQVLSQKVIEFFDSLNQTGCQYCHWKSNYRLKDALCGKTDLDLLVSKENAGIFESILAEMDFRLAIGPGWDRHPSNYHFYGFDDRSGQIIHLHVYYRLITGGALVKNFRLPLEQMLFQNSRYIENVRVPSKGAELLIFVLRKTVEHSSLVEYTLVRREYASIKKELQWLHDSDTETEALELLRNWLPSVDAKLFTDCIQALFSRASFWRRFWLGHRMRSALKSYALFSPVRTSILVNYRFIRLLSQRFLRNKKAYSMARGGAVIAFVGGEAVGKSTLLSEIHSWLKEHFAVDIAHAGKPPSSWATVLPNFLMPLLRHLLPKIRTNTVEVEEANTSETKDFPDERRHSLLYIIRSLMIAYDQRTLLVKTYRKASHGTIILCDRYPSATMEGMDGPRVDPSWFVSRFSVKRILAQIEQKLYASVPPPDLVLFLTVPIEIALQRNATRRKKEGTEPDAYVRSRHALMMKWHIPNISICRIDTKRPLEETLLIVKRAVWDFI